VRIYRAAGANYDDVSDVGLAGASFPVVTPDERTIYFSTGGGNIWVARRDAIADPFSNFERVAELHGAPTWISADECEIYLMDTLDEYPLQQTEILRARRGN